MTNIYLGEDSWYAKHGLPYCRGRGINAATARCIAKKIIAELRQGWTFERTGERIRMTPALARKRLIYLITLARKHGGDPEAVRRVVARALKKIRTVASPIRTSPPRPSPPPSQLDHLGR